MVQIVSMGNTINLVDGVRKNQTFNANRTWPSGALTCFNEKGQILYKGSKTNVPFKENDR